MSVDTILRILQLAAQYGIPAVRQALQLWDKETITADDLAALKGMIKSPDEYDVRGGDHE